MYCHVYIGIHVCSRFDNDSDTGVDHNSDNDLEQVLAVVTLIEYTDDPIVIDYSNYTVTSYY